MRLQRTGSENRLDFDREECSMAERKTGRPQAPRRGGRYCRQHGSILRKLELWMSQAELDLEESSELGSAHWATMKIDVSIFKDQ